MIFIDRGRIPDPELLSELRAGKGFEEAMDFYSRPPDQREQERFRWREIPWNSAKPALVELFHGKCAFCESNVGTVAHADVEHFRPKSSALGIDGERSPAKYLVRER